MALRYKFPKDKEAEIPKEQRPFYVERDGFFFLDVDGASDNDVLTEFRDNNRELMRLLGAKDIAAAKAKLEKLKDLDPDKYAELQEELKKFQEGKAPKLDEMLATRTEGMKKDYEKKLKDATDTNQSLTGRLSKVLIDDSIATAAGKKGVLPAALEDVKLRGRQVFRLENDTVTAIGADGKPLYGKNAQALTIEEWMDTLAESSKHLFEANKGGGAGGGGGGGTSGYTKANPYAMKTINRTEQARLEKENPALAKQLQAAAQQTA